MEGRYRRILRFAPCIAARPDSIDIPDAGDHYHPLSMKKRFSRYSAAGLIARGALNGSWSRVWRDVPLRRAYDVVVIGGGVHGLAAAYYLAANHGITNVAVLEKAYLGGGGSGRNTAILRSNYLTPEGVVFYDPLPASLQSAGHRSQYERDVLPARSHNPGAQRRISPHHALAGRGQQATGCQLERYRTGRREEAGTGPRYVRSSPLPDYGRPLPPPGGASSGMTRWCGDTRAGADSLGVEMHQKTEVVDIAVTGGDGPGGKGPGGRVTGVRTNRGDISAPVVVNCTAGWATLISDMAGVKLPISTRPLQAAVTEPVKVFLPVVVVSGTLHVYVSQTARGELVFGASVDPYNTYNIRGSLEFTEQTAGHLLELMPGISRMRLLRQWAGLCDMTPDYSPVMGFTPVEGFLCDVGWGTYGFKAGPVSGEQMAEAIATQRTPDLIEPFALSRFERDALVGEKGAAAVGH